MKNKIFVFIFALTLFFMPSCSKKEGEKVNEMKAIPVSVFKVSEKTFLLSEERDGEILPSNRVYLVPTVQGTVIEMKKDIGDSVKKGEIVAIIDHRVIDNQLKGLKNQINTVKAKRILLEKDVKRFKRLYEKDAISKHKLEEIEAEYKATLSTEKALTDQYNSLKERLKDYFVKSPINGTITDKLYDVGNVAAGKPIYVIDDLKKVKIVTNVSEELFNKIDKSSYVEATIPAINLKEKVPISKKSAAVDFVSRSGKVESIIENKDGTIKPGMYVKVKVVIGKYNAPAVDRDSLMRLPATGVYYVFKVNKDNTVQQVNLKLGRINGNYQEVLEGLNIGDMVVVKGQGILKTGFKVDVKEIEKL
ncbi:RND family efflux transporter MFP subunit [Thermotomaculum hydrothermale]|uniref:RND family efflux transporter MFP subunit n=1 Tax=Thermotomaculum hydrothermale TaxID=981385 RepID=A0A7R6SXM2_9BACT|nr:efflux RND transporter periplasmic adaptor subunit [Thermotomaculum hydrothermale]BBB31949.1 RND family efflux transporter MFP subunit [Thermotomaculum hydrothermale]